MAKVVIYLKNNTKIECTTPTNKIDVNQIYNDLKKTRGISKSQVSRIVHKPTKPIE